MGFGYQLGWVFSGKPTLSITSRITSASTTGMTVIVAVIVQNRVNNADLAFVVVPRGNDGYNTRFAPYPQS